MKIFLFILLLLSGTAHTYANNCDAKSDWSLSSSLTYPLANIYLLQVNYKINEKHEVFFGPCFQNFKHTSFNVNAYTLLLGYRNYIWKGLHLEAEIYPAYNNIYSKVTKSYFPGFEMWGEFKIGYRFDFYNDKLYIQPAPGIGFGFFQTNKPPNFDSEITYPIFTPQLVFGIRI